MCCVYDGLEPHNHYEPQQDTNNQIPIDNIKVDLSEIICESRSWSELKIHLKDIDDGALHFCILFIWTLSIVPVFK
jgi:hypothetical protein